MYEERHRYGDRELPTLTIKDKMNFPYLLATQILTFQRAILNVDHSDREINEAINGLVELIPDSWKDKDWDKELEKATIEIKVDNRPSFCGVKCDPKIYKDTYGKEPFTIEKEFNPNKLFHACMNLLDRRGMLGQVTRIEKILGEGWDGGEK